MIQLSDHRARRDPLLVTSREAARILAVSERTLWGLADRGEIPRVRIGRAVRYDVRDLDVWIQRNKAGTKAKPDESFAR